MPILADPRSISAILFVIMKKLGKLFLIASLLGSGLLIAPAEPVQAAACANVSSFGAVTLQMPEISNINGQAVWVRMQGSSGDKVLVEINQADCHEVELDSDSASSWSWQSPMDGASVRRISFPQPAGNSLKIIGLSDGVKVDRVLVTEPNCIPQDFGNNCQKGVSLDADQSGGAEPVALMPPNGPVSGKLHISPTVKENPDLTKLHYSANGKILMREKTAREFDTALLENGKHTVHIMSVLSSGTVVNEMISLEIKNPENALTPVIRWIKLNQSSLQIALLVILSAAAALAVARFIYGVKKSRRERTFRGL